FHSLEQLPEFFLIELPVKIQAEQVIAKHNIWRHLELLRKVICGSEVAVVHSSVQQCSQRASPVQSHLAESLQRIARVAAFFRVLRTNLQYCEIELIKVVVWFFLYRGGELFFLLCKVAFSACQPTCNDMISCALPIFWMDPIQRFARNIELSKSERRGR